MGERASERASDKFESRNLRFISYEFQWVCLRFEQPRVLWKMNNCQLADTQRHFCSAHFGSGFERWRDVHVVRARSKSHCYDCTNEEYTECFHFGRLRNFPLFHRFAELAVMCHVKNADPSAYCVWVIFTCCCFTNECQQVCSCALDWIPLIFHRFHSEREESQSEFQMWHGNLVGA